MRRERPSLLEALHRGAAENVLAAEAIERRLAPAPRVLSGHRCSAHHRSAAAFARCAIPSAVWISGTGPYALIAKCGAPTVTLWPTIAAARESEAQINATGCGSTCEGRHEIVAIDIDGPEAA